MDFGRDMIKTPGIVAKSNIRLVDETHIGDNPMDRKVCQAANFAAKDLFLGNDHPSKPPIPIPRNGGDEEEMADPDWYDKHCKANSIEDNPVSNNNLGVVARLKGDRDMAADMYKKGMSAGPEVKYNAGIVNIQNGDYSSANSNMSGNNTFNAALAKMLGGDAEAAKRILNDSPEKDTAMGHYLMAIIGARTGNGEMVSNELKAAVAEDGTLKDKAMKDLEFRAYWDTLSL